MKICNCLISVVILTILFFSCSYNPERSIEGSVDTGATNKKKLINGEENDTNISSLANKYKPFSKNCGSQDSSVILDYFVEKIFDLDTIRAFKKQINPQKVEYILLEAPQDSAYYRIQLGINNKLRFVPYFNFRLYTKDCTIYLLDTFRDSLIPVLQ